MHKIVPQTLQNSSLAPFDKRKEKVSQEEGLFLRLLGDWPLNTLSFPMVFCLSTGKFFSHNQYNDPVVS